MTVREKLLAIFENNRGDSFSGEGLSETLGVSRNAIWKAINQLKEEGYQITASKKDGYRFSGENDILSPALIGRFLPENLPVEIEILESVPSTNTFLKQQAAEGEKEGKIIIAKQQTAGKGRLGRTFCSPKGTGLYLSILLRPKILPEKSLYITTAAAVATAEAIETVSGKKPEIKWVNDLFLNGKKCCGILTEASLDLESGGLEYAVLGIGIDLCRPENGYPQELEKIIGCVFETKPSEETKSRLAAEIIKNFFVYYKNLAQKPFLEKYRRRSLLTGHEITVLSDPPKAAVAIGIDDDFGLIVQIPEGRTVLRSGEVSVRLNK